MCGIAGFIQTVDDVRKPFNRLDAMLKAIRRRGPDDWGMEFIGFNPAAEAPRSEHIRWTNDPIARVALGHARLSILDLSEAGRQPMWSQDGRLCITYNGEIYNYIELRQQLSAETTFRTRTDTEVLLEAYRKWGLQMLERLDGMFAFALWDGNRRQLICARDAIGVKPFYYSRERDRFCFASEPRAVLAGLGTPPHLDAVRIAEFLALGVSDHDEGTSYREVQQLRGGSWMVVDLDGTISERGSFWSLAPEQEIHDEEVLKSVREELELAIQRQMRSDVPVGSCLSGGLDSGSVAATVSRQLGKNAEDFTALTLVNKDFEGDESALASATATRTGVRWRTVEPAIGDVADEIEEMTRTMDEPFPSLSMFAQRKIMKEASSLGLKVMLDGQGGDEVFLGYLRVAQRAPAEYLRNGSVGSALHEWRALGRNASHSISQSLMGNVFFGSPRMVQWRNARRISSVVGRDLLENVRLQTAKDMYTSPHGVAGLQVAELTRFCLPQLLRFEDRNSMAYGVEARVPLLSVQLVKLGLSLPLRWKVNDGWTKYALRLAMKDELPNEVVWSRRKRGFEVPQRRWIEAARPRISRWLEELPAACPIDVKGLLSAIDRGKAGEPWLWRCLSTALWMRFSEVQV